MTPGPLLLDTNVLVYAVGSDHPLREPCRRLLRVVASGEARATTTPEVIQEFIHVRARRRGRADAVAGARSYAALLGPLAVVDDDALAVALDVYATVDALGPFDALLAGVAMARDYVLVTADSGFRSLPGLTWLTPAAALAR